MNHLKKRLRERRENKEAQKQKHLAIRAEAEKKKAAPKKKKTAAKRKKPAAKKK